jgi:hypothetical protein
MCRCACVHFVRVALCITVSQICDGAGFSAHMFVSRTAFSLTTKLSAEHETPPIANVPFAAGQSLLCCPLNKFNPVSKVNCLCCVVIVKK